MQQDSANHPERDVKIRPAEEGGESLMHPTEALAYTMVGWHCNHPLAWFPIGVFPIH